MSAATQSNDNDTPGILVFVYGTLKKGHSNHQLLEESKLLGTYAVAGAYEFMDLGYFPAVLRAPGNPLRWIMGEVYEVDEDVLTSLDILEGHPNFYERIKVRTPFRNAWMYTFPATITKRQSWTHVMEPAWRMSDSEQAWIRERSLPAVVETDYVSRGW